jgi:8-amino-7-oxononanoate synthase
MEGDITPVPALCEIAKNTRALLWVDDAHGVGVLGKTGKGVCEYFSLSQNEVDCLIQPLGKAFGSYGAMISGEASLIQTIEQLAKSYRYSTHIPASLPACGLAALPLINAGNQINSLTENILFFNKVASENNIQLINEAITPIRCVITHANENTMAMQEKLKSRGHLVSGIRTPTVPRNAARLRISLTSLHTKNQIYQLLSDLSDCCG